MITNILRSLGLTQDEMKIFLQCLELGPQPASRIAKICEEPRNTIRSRLDGLVKKGVMVKTRRANTQYYATEKKENLIKHLKFKKLRMQEKIDEQIQLLEVYGDELSSRHFAKSRPKITFYEGMAGLEKVYEDTLSAKKGLKSWASVGDMFEAMPKYFQTYFERRKNKGIAMRSIHPDTESAKQRAAENKKELRQTALVPSETFQWTPEIQIYNNKVNIASWKEKLGIIIESDEIAEAMSAIFDMAFAGASHYNQVSGIENYEELTQ